ncbi:MAG TPA: DUF885 domain-containing protein, partial [Candidatus Polarisedimenticolaceae bacterium]|nr:DUF885 domain-containing protein [Candidatus Polarisedimenticolaceae bacterium]
MRRTIGMLLALATWLGGCAPDDPATRLDQLIEREWLARLTEFPEFATSVGVHERNHLLTSMTIDDLARRDKMWRGLLEQLDEIDPGRLTTEDRIDYEMLRDQLEERTESFRFGDYQIPINSESGFHTGFARLPFDVPLDDADDYDDYIARMRAWPALVDQQITLMRIGLDRGMTPPRVVLAGVERTMEAQLVEEPRDSDFYAPFRAFPVGVSAAEHERLERAGRAAIAESIVPGYRALRDFFVGEYVPAARETLGASALPDGAVYYAWRVRWYTTLDIDADEIHELGLSEVARIRAEMTGVIARTGFEGSFDEFLTFLREDPRFYAKTPQQLLERAAWITKRMDGELPALFGRLPRLPYTVEPVPDGIAARYTAGRYVGAPVGSSQPGRYWVNTYALETRPLYTLEALSLHEAVP